MKKKKYGQDVKPERDPIFTSVCHPYTIVDFKDIVEDSIPSKIIAIVGRCHACRGIQMGFKSANNIDRSKLAYYLHGNSKWLIPSEEVIDLRTEPDKPHGDLGRADIPQPIRSIDNQDLGSDDIAWDEEIT